MLESRTVIRNWHRRCCDTSEGRPNSSEKQLLPRQSRSGYRRQSRHWDCWNQGSTDSSNTGNPNLPTGEANIAEAWFSDKHRSGAGRVGPPPCSHTGCNGCDSHFIHEILVTRAIMAMISENAQIVLAANCVNLVFDGIIRFLSRVVGPAPVAMIG